MRAGGGGCSVHQALTIEAATVVKQAVALARRRGHAQVTPLHVANTMLSVSNGLLRTACLQSHSHPLQCKALELCFNVALNRLPAASSSSPHMSGGHSHQQQRPQQYPTISNALVAAFKRAQAHQRRGSIENQQQPILAVKIELEQLIISILDDPSVSRVMREAGFSSTQVKANVEQVVPLELCSPQLPPSSSNKSKSENNNNSLLNAVLSSCAGDPVKDGDVASVLESLMMSMRRSRKSIVIVGECLANIEVVVRGMMDKVEKGDDVPDESLRELKFISIPVSSFGHLQREEVEQKIKELKSLVRSVVGKGSVVLYLGDLKWITDSRVQDQGRKSYYCPVEHMIMEFGRLISCGNINGENGRCWLLGVATFQTYMRCRSCHHSLESLWGLHPITLPAASLGLSLSTQTHESGAQSESRISKKAENGSCQNLLDHQGELSCCGDCSAKFEAEYSRSLQTSTVSNTNSTLSNLPSWLKDETKRLEDLNDQNYFPVRELCKKWNSICSLAHKQNTNSLERTSTFSSPTISPSSSMSSFFSQDHQQLEHESRDLQIWAPKQSVSPLSSTPNSASSSDIIMEMDYYIPRFKEFNAENLNILCNALEQKVPWQKEVVPEIAGTILQCRSGMLRRKEKPKSGLDFSSRVVKEETWLFFQGLDVEAKEKIARELAKVVFGSYSNFVSLALSSFSYSTRADSAEDINIKNKRCRDEQSGGYIGRLAQAILENPHRVFLVEDVEQADFSSQVGIKRAIERGRINNSSGEEVSLGDAIIILSCESFNSRSRACSPRSGSVKQKSSADCSEEEKRASSSGDQETSPCVSLDLNVSFDDDRVEDDQSIDDMGIVENVDRRIVFKMRDL